MLPLVKLAWRNVRKNWQHSLSAILSIASGFIAVGVFHGYIMHVEGQFSEGYGRRFMLGDLMVFAESKKGEGSQDGIDFSFFDAAEKKFLTKNDQKIIEDFMAIHKGEIEQSVRFLDIAGMITNGKSNTIFAGYGIDEPQASRMRSASWEWNTLSGVPLFLSKDPAPAVVGKGMAALLDCKAVGVDLDTIPLVPYMKPTGTLECLRQQVQMTTMTASGQVNAIDVNIVGVMDGGIPALDRAWVTLPLPLAQMLTSTDELSMFTIKLNDGVSITKFAEELMTFARQKGSKIEAQSWKDHRYGVVYVKAMKILGIFRSFVLIIVIAIGCMTVINTLIKSVSERTREIGTLRSLGFLQREIMFMFAFEGFFLAVIANIVGFVSTISIMLLVNFFKITYDPGFISSRVPLNIDPVPLTYLMSAVGLCVIASFAALYPASKAAKTNIPEALSHV